MITLHGPFSRRQQRFLRRLPGKRRAWNRLGTELLWGLIFVPDTP
jgi:hypothetical protein